MLCLDTKTGWASLSFVSTERSFDVQVIPDRTGGASVWLEIHIPLQVASQEHDWGELGNRLICSRGGFGFALTQTMFRFLSWKCDIRAVA